MTNRKREARNPWLPALMRLTEEEGQPPRGTGCPASWPASEHPVERAHGGPACISCRQTLPEVRKTRFRFRQKGEWRGAVAPVKGILGLFAEFVATLGGAFSAGSPQALSVGALGGPRSTLARIPEERRSFCDKLGIVSCSTRLTADTMPRVTV